MSYKDDQAEIRALIERANQLTPDEITRLIAAWNASTPAAWDPVVAAVISLAGSAEAVDSAVASGWAAWNATLNAAGDDATNATYSAAQAASTAAFALTFRDKLPPGHYRALTDSWATEIGRVHSEDPAPESKRMPHMKIVDDILAELSDRSGFDGWWGDIDPDIQTEIRQALAARVETALAAAGWVRRRTTRGQP